VPDAKPTWIYREQLRQAGAIEGLFRSHPEQKIDAAMALIMVLGRSISSAKSEVDLGEFLANPVFI
jgi:hypothetical protein